MRILRRIVGKTKLNRINNWVIKQECDVKKIGDWVSRERREWNANLSRISRDLCMLLEMCQRTNGKLKDLERISIIDKDSWPKTRAKENINNFPHV